MAGVVWGFPPIFPSFSLTNFSLKGPATAMNGRRINPGIAGLAMWVLFATLFTGVQSLASGDNVRRFKITLATEPENAQVRILESTEPYSPQMTLPEGRYHLSVTAPGYQGEHGTIEIKDKDWSGLVRLSPLKSDNPPAQSTTTAMDQECEKLRQEQKKSSEEYATLQEKVDRLEKEKDRLAETLKELTAKNNKSAKTHQENSADASAATPSPPEKTTSDAPSATERPPSPPATSKGSSLTASVPPATAKSALSVTPDEKTQPVPPPSAAVAATSTPPETEKPSPSTTATRPFSSSATTSASASSPADKSPVSTPLTVAKTPPTKAPSPTSPPAYKPTRDDIDEGVERVIFLLQDVPSQQQKNRTQIRTLLDRLQASAPNDPEVQRVKRLFEERYIVYVGTFSSEDKATSLETSLRAVNIPTFRQHFQIQGVAMLRVCAGLFQQRQEAMDVLTTIQREFSIEDAIVKKLSR